METLLKTDGTSVEYTPQGKYFTLEELQKAVGGYIEIVPIDKEYSLVVNEEGKLMGLPINEVATRLYRKVRYTNDFIVGEALLCNSSQIN